MSSRRQKLLSRVNWYLQSSLKHITELITGNKSYYRGGRYRQVSLYSFPREASIFICVFDAIHTIHSPNSRNCRGRIRHHIGLCQLFYERGLSIAYFTSIDCLVNDHMGELHVYTIQWNAVIHRYPNFNIITYNGELGKPIVIRNT